MERSFRRRRIDPLYRVDEMIGRSTVLVVLATLVLTGTAAADGDPASDVLYLKNVFLPFPAPPRDAANALQGAVDQAYARRFRVKVAVIASAPDLGSVPELFDRPTQYAKFLGTELRSFYIGRLRYAASDDSMHARFTIRITTRKGAPAGRLTAPFQMLEPERVTTITWRVPRTASSRLRFCVVAVDRAGNRSPAACAPLRVR
jgi:hypothetical protein